MGGISLCAGSGCDGGAEGRAQRRNSEMGQPARDCDGCVDRVVAAVVVAAEGAVGSSADGVAGRRRCGG